MDKEFIIAIELGSSKMTGIAGKKNLDGSITILAVAKEDSTLCIRKGVVYNIDKTTTALTNLVKKLKNNLKTEIAKVYVGIGGQSLRSIKNTIVREQPEEAIITQDMVDSILDSNRAMSYTDQKILEAAIQEYKVDMQYQIDPIGIECKRLEGNFLNILWRRSFYNKLEKCFESAHIRIADMYIAPLILAENVLTEVERRAGCMLVDLGADTTTVSVYWHNILRHLAVIPLGSNNITKDIASLQIEEKLQIDENEAETIKLRYASALTENIDSNDLQNITISGDRNIDSATLADIVEARIEEIIENVWMQVPNEYADKLMLGGIILTGGGANMRNMEKAFQHYTHINKVRTAKFVNLTINTAYPDQLPHDGSLNTVLSILAKGNENCAGNNVNNDLFNGNYDGTSANANAQHDEEKKAEEERKKQEEEKKAEEEKRLAEEKAAEEAAEAQRLAEEAARKHSPFHRFFNSLKRFGNTIIEGDNEEGK